jgi:hypothetical protein
MLRCALGFATLRGPAIRVACRNFRHLYLKNGNKIGVLFAVFCSSIERAFIDTSGKVVSC